MGSQKFAVRVKANPDKLAAHQMGINEVADALRSWNVNLPVGTLWGKDRTMNIQATGQLWNAEEFKDMTVAFRNGIPVRLEDVATVVDSVEDERTAAWMFQDGEMKRTVMLIVMRQPNSNVVETNDAVKRLLPRSRNSFRRRSRSAFVATDRKRFVRLSRTFNSP